ncbi:MAG: alanine racemase [Chitinophagaceae bacterium]|nr:alanine racemase [Chitinophagaceae bacterium]MCB9045479.1 alanine racemase [Chitinophagales bacterium]
MTSSSKIILDKEAMQNNWDFMRSYFGEDQKISAVVKGNAYGHGIETYIPLAEECGVNHFSVFNASEAYSVHSVASTSSTIMIMGSMEDKDIVWAIEHDIEFYVFDMYRMNLAIAEAKRLNKRAIIHIEAETGMYRTGFDIEQMPGVIEILKKHKDQLRFRGLCMHFAGAEHISNYVRLKQQKIIFKKILKLFNSCSMPPEMVHTCCSAASIRYPDMRYDMLRIGILQYGFWPSPEMMVAYMSDQQLMNGSSPLKRVIHWESRVMSIKHVPKGSFVGYGYTYLAEQDMKVAVIPVGYAHGFARSLSNSGRVLINGYRLPVIGIVNMNCIAVDISQVDKVQYNDPVVLIGKQNDREVSVASFGEMTNQLNYELLTRLPHNIPRYVMA